MIKIDSLVLAINAAKQPSTDYPITLNDAFQKSVDRALIRLLFDLVGILSILYITNTLLQTYLTASAVDNLLPIIPFVVIIWFVIAKRAAIYNLESERRFLDNVKKAVVVSVLFSVVLAGSLFLLELPVSREFIILHALLSLLFVTGIRYTGHFITRRQNTEEKTERQGILVVGANELGAEAAEAIVSRSENRLKVVGYLDEYEKGTYRTLPILGTLNDGIEEIIGTHDISQVVISPAQAESEQALNIINYLSTLPVKIHVVSKQSQLQRYRPLVRQFEGLIFLTLRHPVQTFYQRMAKRALDLIGASIMLLLVLPVLGAIAIAIRLDSEGPILFKQQRIGEKGRAFAMLKFRSMVVNAEALRANVIEQDSSGNIIHKKPNDPRVTRIGLILRRTSLDELPQLFNVLKGDMSLVGPRPEMPWLVKDYQPWQRQRFTVPQGITGWWQVTGRSEKPMHLSTDDDLFYINNYSFWLDLKILLLTIPALLNGKGAF
jgi:exopolysaccharide biosynthesis polyprenyl glycosylphosphotransferase